MFQMSHTTEEVGEGPSTKQPREGVLAWPVLQYTLSLERMRHLQEGRTLRRLLNMERKRAGFQECQELSFLEGRRPFPASLPS